MTAPLVAVVFDHTALLTLGAGNRLLAGLVAQAHAQPGRYVYAPALCVASLPPESIGEALRRSTWASPRLTGPRDDPW
ncbi:MAG: hypothetical protein WCF33_11300 [Pseudonocardiaceae bacterium]